MCRLRNEINQTVRFTGVDAAAEMKSNVMDSLTYGGGLGFSFAKNDLSLGINYSLQMSEHMTNHGVQATFPFRLLKFGCFFACSGIKCNNMFCRVPNEYTSYTYHHICLATQWAAKPFLFHDDFEQL